MFSINWNKYDFIPFISRSYLLETFHIVRTGPYIIKIWIELGQVSILQCQKAYKTFAPLKLSLNSDPYFGLKLNSLTNNEKSDLRTHKWRDPRIGFLSRFHPTYTRITRCKLHPTCAKNTNGRMPDGGTDGRIYEWAKRSEGVRTDTHTDGKMDRWTNRLTDPAIEWRARCKKQGRIHGNPVTDGWAGAVMRKPLGIQKCNGPTYWPTDQHGKV